MHPVRAEGLKTGAGQEKCRKGPPCVGKTCAVSENRSRRRKMKRVLSVVLSVILLGLSPVLYPLRLHAEEATSEGSVPVVAGVSMSISADFGIHFYIRAPEGALQVGAYIEEVRVTGERQEDGSYRVSFRHLAPKQMTVVVCAEPYCILPGGTELRGEACNFSICDYATQLLAGDPDPSLRALAVAMLNYGAAAQRYSAYNIRDLANRNLSSRDRQFEAREYESELYRLAGDPTQTRAEIGGATLLLQSRLRFKIFVDIEGQEELRANNGAPADEIVNGMTPAEEAARLAEGVYLELSPDPHFTTVYRYPLVKCSDYEGYRAITDGLYATEMSRVFYFRVCTEEGESVGISYSVESYAASVAESSSARRLVEAMMNFGDAARAYEASHA